eukprot:9132676-Prorocentrum_lima.AAC.1
MCIRDRWCRLLSSSLSSPASAAWVAHSWASLCRMAAWHQQASCDPAASSADCWTLVPSQSSATEASQHL